ncbi:imidazole glycerol phosphate synthase subunit HisH [Pigmentiphaga sp. CHJ604]|uniref:imidazole glycerol phosphate synthase subunit HisH n=1 Tax=Pigmentiphaga sp. CHJ604 TaxID=3081984 RepID=UPI0030CE0EC6
MIVIIDAEFGNIRSVGNMLLACGHQFEIATSPAQAINATKFILPGVGAFDHGMQQLHKGGWSDFLHEAVIDKKTPILGICLGMQLMCTQSEEGQLPGLGWVDASVQRFRFMKDSQHKVPHMGWNRVSVVRPNPLISETDSQRFYFVHSYFIACSEEEVVIGKTEYGNSFVSSFQKNNIYGVQFHPEKSHRFGMALMKNFAEHAK